MQSFIDEQLRHDIKELLLKHDEMSRVISNAAITVVGNLALEEKKLVKRAKDKRAQYEQVCKDYSDSEYSFQQAMNDPSSKPKKCDDLYKKLEDMRKRRVASWEEIQHTEQELAQVRLTQQGGDELEEILRVEFENVSTKIQYFRKNHPQLVEDVEHEIATFFSIKPSMRNGC